MFADVGNVPAVMQTGAGDHSAGMFGASGMWIFALVIIFFALAFFGGNFGGRRDGHVDGLVGGAAPAAFTELNARLDSIQREVGHNNDLAELRALYTQACATDMNVTQQAFNVSNLINTTRTDTLLNFKDIALQNANCCCEIQRGQDNIRFQQAQDTCAIVNAIRTDGDSTRNMILQDKIESLRDALSAERLANSQCMQNAYLVNQLRPYPTPAFSVCPPGAYGPFGVPFKDGYGVA